MQFKFDAVTINGNDVEFTVDEHSGYNQNPPNGNELCLSITCDGEDGSQGDTGPNDCLNQRFLDSDDSVPNQYGFTTNGTDATSQYITFNFDRNATIGETNINGGFGLYYKNLQGAVCNMIIIDKNDPSRWVSYMKVSFALQSGGQYYKTLNANYVGGSSGFDWSTTGSNYCIYLNITI